MSYYFSKTLNTTFEQAVEKTTEALQAEEEEDGEREANRILDASAPQQRNPRKLVRIRNVPKRHRVDQGERGHEGQTVQKHEQHIRFKI